MWKDRLRKKSRHIYQNRYSNRVMRSRQLFKLAKLSFLGVVALFVIAVILLPVLSFGLPSPDKIIRKEGFSTKILDRNGEVLYDIYADERRTPVTLDQVPLYLRQATISIEDKNFYKHQGFDVGGYFRAVFNGLLSSERTIFRKIKEFILAIQIEKKYSKDQILQMYLNEIPYGGTAYGVESASEVYYGKKVRDLNLVECAILAGIPQRPPYYSPFSQTPKAYIDRTKAVLRRMREDGYITKEQEEASVNELPNVVFQAKGASFKAPHFVQYVQSILEERYGEKSVETGGLKVTTTLDLKLQEKAQEIVAEEIARVEKQRITNGAAIVLNPRTGEILAMVGSKDFNDPDYDGQVNVTTSLRQPGSAFKPFTYVTAFKEGYTPSTLIMDVETVFPGGVNLPEYKPVNYDGKFRGPIQLRYALANSINIPAVKMLARVGIKDVLATANEMGITTLKPDQATLNRVGLSLTLGGGEVRLIDLTAAYAPFMNKGFRAEPVAILKVEDSDGKVLEENEPEAKKRVLTEEQAYLIANILSDNASRADVFGTNSLLNIAGKNVAVKTGTTNDRRDNWTIGGNIEGLVGVWVGNNDNSEMLNVASGVSGASPIWRRILLEALKDKPNAAFEVPSGIISMEVDSLSGYKAHDGFPSRSEFFIKGMEPTDDPVHVKLKVCKTDGKLATPSDIAAGNYDEREFYVFKEEDPTAGSGGVNRWQEGILSWLTAQSDSKYHPPTDYCGTQNPVNVEFINPTDRSSNLSNNFTVKFKAASTNDIVRAELFIDGSSVRSYDGPPFTYEVNLSDGVHAIKAKARDANGNESERVVTVGVNKAWDYAAP
jgi:penicillin-binding protein 1C